MTKTNIEEKLAEVFEANFLDGDKLPATATTFTAEGCFDAFKFGYEESLTSLVEDIEGMMKDVPLGDFMQTESRIVREGHNQALLQVEEHIRSLIKENGGTR